MARPPAATPMRSLPILALLKVHSLWLSSVNATVPEPYLDEVFHIPQAQAFWDGNWSHYDPKITTPPGLYYFSHAVNSVWNLVLRKDGKQTIEDLRYVDALLLWLLFIGLRIFRNIRTHQENPGGIIYRELNMMLFPLLFFLSALYYTDILSALTVVFAYICWGKSQSTLRQDALYWQFLHFVAGHAALATRQTNIFWVSIFLGGLQVVQTTSLLAEGKLPSPPVVGASVEDYFQTTYNIVTGALACVPRLMLDLLPQLGLLACFAQFVYSNGGVVLGDKENHIASLHLSQMLYIWPFIAFFSWPLLLPQLIELKTLRARLPRPVIAVAVMGLMAAIVHFNTIVHPFTLADNRHYMFYVFRILLKHPLTKYAAVPIYFICAWLVVNALGSPHMQKGTKQPLIGERVSFVLVWLGTTSLSLVTAPLVEPRYFIIPWLIWRMHVPSVITGKEEGKVDDKKAKPEEEQGKNAVVELIESNVLWIELAWFLLVNYVTCWMFLERGFAWPQEPGKVQRFMW